MELDSVESIADDDLEKTGRLADELRAVQTSLGRDPGETKPEISEKSLAEIADRVARLEDDAEGTWLAPLATAIAKDAVAQTKRSADVDELAAKFVGAKAPALELTGLDGKPIELDPAKPVLLHFWDYRGDKLEEPYGQVGYISFLQGKREKLGMQIVGVAVDKGLGENGQAAAVKRSVRKLREFMRLKYPIALDDGSLLAKFGDPRRLGAKLPLWVVVDHEGKVQSYYAGFYEADTRKGLVALDEEVVKAIRKMHGRE